MHTLGEDEEILCTNSHGDSRGTHGRGRTPSSASETAVLRDEVVDLLALARKASSGGVTSTSSSSSSLSPINRDFNSIDMTRSTSSASAHTGGDSLSPPHSATSGTFSRTRLAAPGTASKEELEALARSVSPAFNAPPPILKPTKKKFGGLFGGGKKGEAAAGAKGSPTFPTAWQNQARTDVSQRSPSPLPPPSCAMPSTDRNIRAAPLQGAQDRSHRAPPVAGSHRYQMTAQHRRKRSMSVGDASAFLPTPLAATGDTRKPRPAVYDESYFSNLKQPYCSTSLGEGSQKRANQIARLGIVEDVDGKLSAAGQEQEEETLANAKERLLAQARTAIGHPSAHQKRQGQLLFQGETGDLHLTAKSHPSQTTWTSPLQQAESRTARNNSDASILDPFLPAGHQSNKPRGPMHLTVPVAGSVNGRISPDSLAAIGPPPASPLPSPPRTSSTLPGVPNAARPMHAVSRTPSPSQRMHLPPARSPAPTSPLPPLPAAICPAPVQRAVKEPSLSPPQPKRSPPAVPAASADKTEYDFEFRPHRTKQQGRPRLSPLQERVASPIESPSLDKMAVPARPFGTRGIVQRPPSALDMTLVPSPSPSSAAASSSAATSSSASSTKSLAASTSTSSIPTPKAREFNQAQIRRRQETESTLASQYSTEGEFEGYDPSRSSGSSAVSSSTTGNSMHASGVSSHASHTTLSSTTSYSSNSSMTSYNSSSSCLSRPSLSMDGHSTEDEMSVSSHAGGGFVHVNMAVPMKPPKRGMVPSPSTESINNLAGIGLAKGQYPHSRRMHFGWNKHKAMHDLASHAEDVELGHSGDDENAIRVLQRDMIQGNISEEGVSSPGSEDDAYAGIIADYGTSKQHQGNDEGYIGSSPELVSTGKGLSKSRELLLY